MSDRFTFRAWNIAQKRYMEDLRLIGFGELNTFREVEEAELDKYGQPQHYTTYEEDEVVLEQCTGIMDKNRKLIFEGDFLKTPDGSICYVVWMGTSFWLKSPGSGAYDLEYNSFYEHCEVIGNIHENPELLKESK